MIKVYHCWLALGCSHIIFIMNNIFQENNMVMEPPSDEIGLCKDWDAFQSLKLMELLLRV